MFYISLLFQDSLQDGDGNVSTVLVDVAWAR